MRFINENTEVPLSTLRHPSMTSDPSSVAIPVIGKFYRGPTPSSSSYVDNIYAFYLNNKYRSGRILQPNLAGTL
jgi:hypothetical protein